MIGNGDRGTSARSVPAISDIIPDAPLYIVMVDYGRVLGQEAVVHPNQTREGVIRDMIGGQFDRVLYILECYAREGSCKDISEDIAREVAGRVQRDPVSDDIINFVARHAGDALALELRAA